MNYKKLIKNIKELDFTFIDFDYGNHYVTVEKRHGIYLFEFIVTYERSVKNHISSSHENPEESDVEIEITDVTALTIYGLKNRVVEVSEEYHNSITEIIKNNLIGKKY